MKLQRDVFLEEIYKLLKVDKSIYVLSADFGAAALDAIREEFKDNFIHCGISEQAMFDIGTGLALEGKKVVAYAMGPFISLRAIEQIKCGPAMMNLPMTILSVGIGLGYADAGPTHYATEDFACLRAIGGTNIYTASDNLIAEKIAQNSLSNGKLNYIRLDRHPTSNIEFNKENFDFNDGYRIIGEYSEQKIAIISHGRILHSCLKTMNENKDLCFIVDLYNSKPISQKLANKLKNIKKILVVDEQTCSGNLTGAVQEFLAKNNIFNFIKNISLTERYIFENGGRDHLLKLNGLDEDSILAVFKEII